MRRKIVKIAAVGCLLPALLLGGCSRTPAQNMIATEPLQEPTVPADGDPNNVTCKGSYTGDNQSAGDTVVATLGEKQLTNAQLQVYYNMVIADYSGENGPDMGQGLDTQLCPGGGHAITWQQYFLDEAISDWYTRQLLVIKAEGEGFVPDTAAQSYLDSLGEITGGDDALLAYAWDLNFGYFYCRDNLCWETQSDAVELRCILLPKVEVDAETAGDILSQAEVGNETDFAQLALEYSRDGAAANGGLYTGVVAENLPEGAASWCFDAARAYGDVTLVETDDAYHILYYRGGDEVVVNVEKAVSILAAELSGEGMTVNYSAIVLSAPENWAYSDDQLLYADMAHEDYPQVELMIQQDYDAYYGPNRTVSSHGCGLTCFAMVATYLTDELQSPNDLGPRYHYYSAPSGTDQTLFSIGPAEMGFMLAKRSYSADEAMAALENGQVVISLQRGGIFTQGGHYLVLAGLTEDDKIIVLDPNIHNYHNGPLMEAGFANGFERRYVTGHAESYWIYAPKQVNIPACDRCGEGSAEGSLFVNYICPECRWVDALRQAYLDNL